MSRRLGAIAIVLLALLTAVGTSKVPAKGQAAFAVGNELTVRTSRLPETRGGPRTFTVRPGDRAEVLETIGTVEGDGPIEVRVLLRTGPSTDRIAWGGLTDFEESRP